ncbi:hypothetical protein PHYPSEUDO_014917 [Phytophthora pseudosyringae]|uniref:Uncharacterized protein n=1 Tax=Phytophthora pseudosyringae TaxID=221518 RepID=A0A8T1V6I5_9STRA|nr:hypothetical protein PHYPSEUDO_014917 [Phytophthora pseudosyringae]
MAKLTTSTPLPPSLPLTSGSTRPSPMPAGPLPMPSVVSVLSELPPVVPVGVRCGLHAGAIRRTGGDVVCAGRFAAVNQFQHVQLGHFVAGGVIPPASIEKFDGPGP